MKFTVVRETLLKPLHITSGVVERRHTRPILANLLMVLDDNILSLTGTDSEIEIVAKLAVDLASETGRITVPAKKLVDICRSLPEGQEITFCLEKQKLVITSASSCFSLSTLPADDFPFTEKSEGALSFSVPDSIVKQLINATAFSMAQQDVRYFLNGMLWEVNDDKLRCVATDGHRLALCSKALDINPPSPFQVILPRKAVIELSKLLENSNQAIQFTLDNRLFRAETKEYIFTSKIVDGKFPDYSQVIPKDGKHIAIGSKEALKQAFLRAAILSNEKYLGIRLLFTPNLLTITANNAEQEQAEERVTIQYAGSDIDIGFNVSYLQDITSVINGNSIKITLSDNNSSILIEDPDSADALYVIMPMRL